MHLIDYHIDDLITVSLHFHAMLVPATLTTAYGHKVMVTPCTQGEVKYVFYYIDDINFGHIYSFTQHSGSYTRMVIIPNGIYGIYLEELQHAILNYGCEKGWI